MKHTFQLENIRCSGCKKTITAKLKELNTVEDVQVNIEEKQVIVAFQANDSNDIIQLISEKLTKLGYPETSKAASNNLKVKAASVISCALGKISSKK